MVLILKVAPSGHPDDWVTPTAAASLLVSGRVAWFFGDTGLILRGGYQQGMQSTIEIPGILSTTGKYRALGSLALNRWNLFRRDTYTCQYCGLVLPIKRLTIDHIHPRSRGGRHVWTNVATACRDCNQRKGDLLLEEAGMTLLNVPYAPNRWEALYLANRAILPEQYEYLAKGFRNIAA